MEFNIHNLVDDLGKEGLRRLETVMSAVCDNYEPWADMMMLGGAGDPGVDRFPLDPEQVDSIHITAQRVVEPQ